MQIIQQKRECQESFFFFFTEFGGKAVCLVIAILKDCFNRHDETKHAKKRKDLSDAETARTSDALQQVFLF